MLIVISLPFNSFFTKNDDDEEGWLRLYLEGQIDPLKFNATCGGHVRVARELLEAHAIANGYHLTAFSPSISPPFLLVI